MEPWKGISKYFFFFIIAFLQLSCASLFIPKPPTTFNELHEPQPVLPKEKNEFGLTGLRLGMSKEDVKTIYLKHGLKLEEGKKNKWVSEFSPANPLGLRIQEVNLTFTNDSLDLITLGTYGYGESERFFNYFREEKFNYYLQDTYLRLNWCFGSSYLGGTKKLYEKTFSVNISGIYWKAGDNKIQLRANTSSVGLYFVSVDIYRSTSN